MAEIRKNNLAVVNLDQDNTGFFEVIDGVLVPKASVSGSYLVISSQLVNTTDTQLNVNTQWVGGGTFGTTNGGPVTVTIATSSVDLFGDPTRTPGDLISYTFDNSATFITYFKNTRTALEVNSSTLGGEGRYALPSTASTIQNVLDQTTGNRNLAIIAATSLEDEGLTIEPSVPFTTGGAGVGSNNAKFYQLYNHNTSHEIISACSWICLKDGDPRVGRPYSGTKLKIIDPTDNQSADLLSANSTPDQVLITSTIPVGNIIQSNKPISINKQADQACYAPLQVEGTILATYHDRYFPRTIRIYCKHDNTSVVLYRDDISTKDNQISTHTGDLGDIITITLTETDFDDRWAFFVSNKPIVGTTDGDGDKWRLAVATTDLTPVYRRRNGFETTLQGNTPSVNNTYIVADAEGVVAITRGDGDGGDGEVGFNTNFLKDTYAFGQGKLVNYEIVSGVDQTVTVDYYNSGWVQYATHTFSGAGLTNPDHHQEGSNSGTTPLVDLETVWKWEGSDSFYLVTNDGSADEETQFGWNRDETIIAISY